MTEQTCRVRAMYPRRTGIIIHIISPDESEILKGALEAQQFAIRGSCELSKLIPKYKNQYNVFSVIPQNGTQGLCSVSENSKLCIQIPVGFRYEIKKNR